MIGRNKHLIIYAVMGMILSLSAHGHEYWLQPDQFIVQQDALLQAHIKTGQKFRGNNYAYLPRDVASMHMHLGDKTVPITSRFGDYPAISQPAIGNGINILSVTTHPTKLKYKKPGKFEAFVNDEGLDSVLAEHQKRGLPDTGFTEIYSRYTKSLVKVGNSPGDDYKVGHEFEWVLETNPYQPSRDTLSAQLWWQGKVLANHQFRYFIQTGKTLATDVARTDDNGIAHFPFIPRSTYMLNAVIMLVPNKDDAKKYNAVWDSRWASTTFATN